MRKRKNRKQRLLTMMLCLVLCIVDVIPTGMTAWASEPMAQSALTDDDEGTGGSVATTGLQEEGADSAEGNEDANKDNPDTESPDQATENEETGEENPDRELPDSGEGDPDGEQLEDPDGGQEAEEENPDAEDIESEISEETDAEEASLISTMAESEDVIASGSYTENGSNTRWSIDKNGKLTVEGTGEFGGRSLDEFGYRKTPWYDYADSIKTAEINVQGMTNASGMFYQCSNLTKVDLKKFDTSSVTDMGMMFCFCGSLTSLDLSGFDTSKVTNMSSMFDMCESLTSLDLSSFDTSNVTDMGCMFSGCYSLTSLDLSSFDTSNVTQMFSMFSDCYELPSLDLSSFNTANVEDMSHMFASCAGLDNLDLRSFNTSKVTNMDYMFFKSWSMTELDLSSFDTSHVSSMEAMFNSCHALKRLDLSSFDVGKVTNMESFMPNSPSKKLEVIYTPRNLKCDIPLVYYLDGTPNQETWYRADGTEFNELPKNLDYSIVLTREKPSADSGISSISASKKTRAYYCGDTVGVDDITVTYYSKTGVIIKLTEGFTTNVDEINMSMSTPGKKTLEVTYIEPETDIELTAMIELTVTMLLSEDSVTVALPKETAYVYNGYQHKPVPTVTVKSGDATGKALNAGTDYTVSYTDNINAGTNAQVIIRGTGDYSGRLTATFSIEQAPVTIKAQDVTLAVGDPIPEEFDYDTEGFYNRDERNVTGVSFSLADAEGSPIERDEIDTSKTGTYRIIPQGAQVGDNYAVDEQNGYLPGILTIAEERIVYTVDFNMMGHGAQIESIWSIKAGSLIVEPEQPAEEGYLFTGWYKDRACTKVWNFGVDTVQENITLYARWAAQTGQGGIRIQEIPAQTYTGSQIKPAVVVYAADGETMLKSGKDYTVKYYNNTAADQVKAAGGTYNSLEGGTGNAQNGFDSRLPYVEIKGKGNHAGCVYSNFHIDPVSISDAKGNAAAGFTLKYTDQLVYNAKKDQKPFTSLKYKKAMAAGTDYTVTISAVRAFQYSGEDKTDVSTWSAAGTQENKWIPAIPKGYEGTFRLTIAGKGNYNGEISRTVYVASKTQLLKNASITLGKNQKNVNYDGGKEVELTPGYCENKKYYKVNGSGEIDSTPEANGNDLFTVKSGNSYLIYGTDFIVSYTNNKAVGTATMTITGIGDYKGSKSVTFKIKGETFSAGTIQVKAYDQSKPNDNDFKASMPYTGSAVTQNKVTLTTKATTAKPETKTLVYGKHYTISYKNNVKKGTATMTFTAKPESGYTGKFNKMFKIGAVSLADPASVKAEAVQDTGHEQDSLTSRKDEKENTVYSLNGTVLYTREGAKPSRRIRLSLLDRAGNPTGVVLKEGTDYTVSYANNTAVTANAQNKIPTMTFKGKGNYAGSLKVTYTISEAAMEEGGSNLTILSAAAALDSKKGNDHQYAPKVTVKDGKKTLSAGKDYTVEYKNCSQKEVIDYLTALKNLNVSEGQEGTNDAGSTGTTNSDAAWENLQAKRPCAVIKAVAGSGYATTAGKEIKQYLNVYETKLTANNLYVVVSADPSQVTYMGQEQPVTPEVSVYYGDANAVKEAKKAQITDDAQLTASGGAYKLTRLNRKTDAAGDYTLNYGTNMTAGKNKGSVTVTGEGIYGGSVTVKFTILQRNVYSAP